MHGRLPPNSRRAFGTTRSGLRIPHSTRQPSSQAKTGPLSFPSRPKAWGDSSIGSPHEGNSVASAGSGLQAWRKLASGRGPVQLRPDWLIRPGLASRRSRTDWQSVLRCLGCTSYRSFVAPANGKAPRVMKAPEFHRGFFLLASPYASRKCRGASRCPKRSHSGPQVMAPPSTRSKDVAARSDRRAWSGEGRSPLRRFDCGLLPGRSPRRR